MSWEENFLLWLQDSVRNEYLTPFVQTVTHSVDFGLLWVAIAGGMSLPKKARNAGMGCLFTIIVEFVVVNLVLKKTVARARPYEEIAGLEILCKPPKDYSFPSGHTAVSFAASTALLFGGYKKTGAALLAYSALVGFSRLYLGVHYPTDVAGGAVIGATLAALVRAFFPKPKKKVK